LFAACFRPSIAGQQFQLIEFSSGELGGRAEREIENIWLAKFAKLRGDSGEKCCSISASFDRGLAAKSIELQIKSLANPKRVHM